MPINFKNVFFGFTGSILFLVTVFVICVLSYSTINGLRSKLWTKTTGNVITSTWTYSRSGEVQFKIYYQYKIKTKIYEAERVAYGVDDDSYLKKYERYLRYKDGQSIDVYYDPRDPALSVLEPGVRGWKTLLYLFGFIVFLGYSIFWIVPKITQQYRYFENNKDSIIQLILLVVLAVSCVYLSAMAGEFTFYGVASRTWPKTEGIVLESRLASVSDDSSQGSTSCCSVIYKYKVGVQEYLSDRIYFGGFDNDGKEYARFLSYKPGTHLEVYYNPKNPAMAVLETGVHKWKNVLIMLVFSYCSLLFVVYLGKVLDTDVFQLVTKK
jgi:hypothetical protein